MSGWFDTGYKRSLVSSSKTICLIITSAFQVYNIYSTLPNTKNQNYFLKTILSTLHPVKMVNFMIATLGLAALVPLSVAAPAGSQTAPEAIPRDDAFSFQQWIDDIVADPEGDHLSPEEAVKVAQKETRSGA